MRVLTAGIHLLTTIDGQPATVLFEWNDGSSSDVRGKGSGCGISKRFYKAIVSALNSEDEVGRTDLDSHADAPVVGKNAKITCNVKEWNWRKM